MPRGRPVTSGLSHNRKSDTYESKRKRFAVGNTNAHPKIHSFFSPKKKPNNCETVCKSDSLSPDAKPEDVMMQDEVVTSEDVNSMQPCTTGDNVSQMDQVSAQSTLDTDDAVYIDQATAQSTLDTDDAVYMDQATAQSTLDTDDAVYMDQASAQSTLDTDDVVSMDQPSAQSTLNTDNAVYIDQPSAQSTLNTAKYSQSCNESVDMRKRNIDSILKDFPEFVFSSTGFLCRTCSSFAFPTDRNTSSMKAFICGGSNLGDHPSKRLKDHLGTDLHKRCQQNQTYVTRILSKGGINGLFQAQEMSLREHNRQYFSHLVKCLDYLVNHSIAKSQMGDFVHFLAHSLNEEVTKSFLEKPKTSTSTYGQYLSAGSTDEILTSYSCWCKNKIKESMQNACAFTFFSDDSECNNDHDEMISFLSWIDPNQVLGTLTPHVYLRIQSVGHSENANELTSSYFDAKTLYSSMKNLLLEEGIDQQKVKFICFDGCNVMSGSKNGVQKLWKDDEASVVYVNCRNHRLALVFVHLKKRFELISEFDQLLLDLYIAVEYNKVAKVILAKVQQVNEETPLKIVKAAMTRWLSHFKASTRVLDRYSDILDTMNNLYLKNGDTKCLGIAKRLSSPNNLCTLAVMSDILLETNKLSLMLQATNVNISRVIEKVDEIKSFLENYPASCPNGYYLTKVDQLLDIADTNRIDSRGFNRESRASAAPLSQFDKDKFRLKFIKPFCEALVDEIQVAFYDDQHPILEAFIKLFIQPIQAMSYVSSDFLKNNAQIEVSLEKLVAQYPEIAQLGGTIQSLEDVIKEYRSFVSHICAIKKKHQADFDALISHTSKKLAEKKTLRFENVRAVPQYAIKQLEDEVTSLKERKKLDVATVLDILIKDELVVMYPVVGYLLQIASIIPLSNAISERGFSFMQLVCTSQQASMKDATLDKLLRIRMFPLKLNDQGIKEITEIFNTSFNKNRHIAF